MGEGTQCRAREARQFQCHAMDSRQRPPPGAKLIPLTMGYKYKRTAEGDITEKKARCSLRGDLMRPHQHYNPDHTAAPMADKTTIRLLLAVKAAYGLTAAHFDIKSAFTHETYKYDADVYVKQHPRFDGSYKHGGKGGKLIINLYGSPSGGYYYLQGAQVLLQQHKYTQSQQDPCFFYKIENKRQYTLVGLSTDDFLVVATHKKLVTELHNTLKSKYTTKT